MLSEGINFNALCPTYSLGRFIIAYMLIFNSCLQQHVLSAWTSLREWRIRGFKGYYFLWHARPLQYLTWLNVPGYNPTMVDLDSSQAFTVLSSTNHFLTCVVHWGFKTVVPPLSHAMLEGRGDGFGGLLLCNWFDTLAAITCYGSAWHTSYHALPQIYRGPLQSATHTFLCSAVSDYVQFVVSLCCSRQQRAGIVSDMDSHQL